MAVDRKITGVSNPDLTIEVTAYQWGWNFETPICEEAGETKSWCVNGIYQ